MPPRDKLIAEFAQRMVGKSYDLAVDLRLDDDTREVLHKIDARNHAGFDRSDDFPWMTIRLNTPAQLTTTAVRPRLSPHGVSYGARQSQNL